MDPLFACSNCFTRCRYDELTKKQHFCQKCFKESLRKCSYCCTRYSPESPRHTVCPKCEGDIAKHGVPEVCSICQLKAAYTDHICVRCHRCMSKYGPPFPCRSCQKCRAFNSAQNMVNGELCCWQCVDLAKPIISLKEAEVAASSSSAPSLSIKRRATNHSLSDGESSELAEGDTHESLSGLPTRMATAAELQLDAQSNAAKHMCAMNELKGRIAFLDRHIGLKEKELLEKEKEINIIKIESREMEKMLCKQMRSAENLFLAEMAKLNRKMNALHKENISLKRTLKLKKKKRVENSNVFQNTTAIKNIL